MYQMIFWIELLNDTLSENFSVHGIWFTMRTRAYLKSSISLNQIYVYTTDLQLRMFTKFNE